MAAEYQWSLADLLLVFRQDAMDDFAMDGLVEMHQHPVVERRHWGGGWATLPAVKIACAMRVIKTSEPSECG